MRKIVKTINEKLSSQKNKKASSKPVQTPVISKSASTKIDNEKIAERAYEIWLAKGAAHGTDWQDWFLAEQELVHGVAIK